MQSLYWRKDGRETKAVAPAPFKSEHEFEQTVFETPALLSDIFLLKRQVRGGGKRGVPDIVGVDSEGNVCVIELKNTRVDAGIIPQVLEYAIWAETNPDSIRTLWLEAKDRPEDLTVDWDSYAVRVLVIAPSVDPTTLEHVNKITYPVELIEVTRWAAKSDLWLLANRLEPVLTKRAMPVSGLQTYDRAAYEELHNRVSVAGFLRLADGIQRLAVKNKWPVERKFNKYYCGFKVGNFIVFGVKWLGGRRSYGLFFKVPEVFAKNTRVPGYKIQRYEKLWSQAVFRAEQERIRLSAFSRYFKKALEQRTE